jgi:ectoine hydroxylase-related dioxygenase (phytanoyl-CoA dioxygenase family)
MSQAMVEPAGDVDDAKRKLSEFGLAVLPGVLGAAELDCIREAVRRGIESDQQAGIQLTGFRRIDPDDRNIRLYNLVARDAVFRELVEHPVALALVEHLLGPKVRLSNFTANITGPGSGSMGMHADQGYVTAPWPSWPLAVNIAWAIDDFTAANGATRVVPGSVHAGRGPEWGQDYPEAIALTCPAGSIFAMDGRVWHQTGPNTTRTERRIGMFAYYVRPFILPQVIWQDLVSPALRHTLTPGLKELLGFGERATRNLQTVQGRQIWLDEKTPP